MTQHLKKDDLINVTGGLVHLRNESNSKKETPKVLEIEDWGNNVAYATLMEEKDYNTPGFLSYLNTISMVYDSDTYKEDTMEMFVSKMETMYPSITIKYI